MDRKKILVVDDEFYISRSLSFMFKKEGYDCSSAEDGIEALQKIAQDKPDLIFLDIDIPKKDGYEVCQEIKSNPKTKDIYIIMLTAKGQEVDQKKGFQVGADEYLMKPFDPRWIRKKVKEVLN